jgi:hypothetical protein
MIMGQPVFMGIGGTKTSFTNDFHFIVDFQQG